MLVPFLFALLTKNSSADVLGLGESLRIPTSAAQPVQVSTRRPIQVIDRGREIEVVGKRLGAALITQGHQTWWINVTTPSTAKMFRQFDTLIERMLGLELSFEGDEITVRGRLLRLDDWTRLAEIQRANGSPWRFRAQIDSMIPLDKIYPLLGGRKPHLWELSLRPTITVHSHVSKLDQLPGFADFAAYGLKPEPASESNVQKSVRLELILAEVMNSAAHHLGLQYEDGQSVQLLPKVAGPESLDAKLSFLAQSGEAKILAKPTLVAKAGTDAEFLAGGEFAIRTSSYKSKDVSWKRHGLWLKFRPEWKGDFSVAVKIETEFSQPDFSQMVDGIPSLRTNKTNTAIDIDLGRTMLMSGLVQIQNGQSKFGLPGLKDMPVLGALFSSESFQQHKSELLVFLKPVIAEPEP